MCKFTKEVTSWVVRANDIVTPDTTTGLDSTTDLSGRLPDDLSEVTSRLGETWVGVVVVLDLIVPSIDGTDWRVTNGQVFTVWTTRVDQVTGTVVVVSIVLSVLGQFIRPSQWVGVLVQSSLDVVFVQHTLGKVRQV